MRRFYSWFFVGVLTFGFGFLVFNLFWSDRVPPIVGIDPPAAMPACECSDDAGFPGRSRDISSLRKNKSGIFPKGEFVLSYEERDVSYDEWYGKHLNAMGERSLLDDKDPGVEIYRFLWLRS